MRAIIALAIFAVLINYIQATEERKRKCGDNEHLAKSPEFCPRDSCAKLNPKFKCPQLPAIPLPSGPDCVCVDGYLRNPDGKCVKAKRCPKDQTCGVNEVFNKNRTSCPGDSCRLILIKPLCIANQKPDPGCECRKGYMRNQYKQCIPRDQCPEAQKCPINEAYDLCGTYCPRTCKNRFMPIPPCIAACKEGCDCLPGFYRHDNKTCVPVEKCSPPECMKNAHYATCLGPCDTVCKDKSCSQYCSDGCACNKGYFKKSPFECVKFSDYHECPKDERWVECIMGMCAAQTCKELGYPVACADIIGPCKDAGCVCKEGYLRNSKKVCIPQDKCPNCGGDYNATAGCSNYCGNSCSDYKDTNKACTELCQYNGCQCRKGHVYNEVIQKCVKPEDCPAPCSDPNAERVSCATHCPATCDKPVSDPCPYASCTKNGCQCKPGYILNRPKGKCIKIKECPAHKPCNGDPNAKIKECPNPCPATCSRPDQKLCPVPCSEVGCECRSGYIRNKHPLDKCIKPCECEEQEDMQS